MYCKTLIRSAVVTMALALTFVGCDRASVVEPEIGRSSDGIFLTGNLRKVTGSDGTIASASAWIDGSGGSVNIGPHHLTVPAGAVSGRTLFAMKLSNPADVVIDLTATSEGSATVNDVGARGFATPVSLRIKYGVMDWTNESSLTVVWLRPDGVLEPVPSVVNTSYKWVTGSIDHFSGYSVADRCQDDAC